MLVLLAMFAGVCWGVPGCLAGRERDLPLLHAQLPSPRPGPAALPPPHPPLRYRLLSDATKAKENLHGLDIVGHTLEVNWAPAEVPVEQLALPAAAAPPPLPPGVPPPVTNLPESLNEGVEAGTVGGGLKLTGQVSRAGGQGWLARCKLQLC